MSIISDQALADLKSAVQGEATVVNSVVTFIGGIPDMIRKAVAAAQNNGDDVSDAVEEVVKSIETQGSQLTAAITTTSDGQPAPIGNLPASNTGSASDASSAAKDATA